MGLFTRAIRPPPDDITPNTNDPASVPPSTVGPDQLVVPGDPHGVEFAGTPRLATPLPQILPSPWSGWPAEWWPPNWNGRQGSPLTGTAYICVDKNANLMATMPPYLVGAADTLDAGWMVNPQPETYTCWEEFAKQLFKHYQLGEAFVLATARYSTGWPARFHCVPPWLVTVEIDNGVRRYRIGEDDVSGDVLHIRYDSDVSAARGTGPLEAVRSEIIAAEATMRYAMTLMAGGGIPASVLEHPEELSPEQALALKSDWVTARASSIGEPAVLSGGIQWRPTQMNPTEMSAVELLQFYKSQIAVALGMPPSLLSLPTGDSMTYANQTSYFDFHWRSDLRPRAQMVMSSLSGWLLPRGTRLEVNRDAYVQPPPYERAQTYQILNSIVDADGNPAFSMSEIRDAERIDDSSPDLKSGVLRG